MRNSQDTHKVATHVKTNDAVGEITNVLWNGYFICISSFWNKNPLNVLKSSFFYMSKLFQQRHKTFIYTGYNFQETATKCG